MFLAYYDIRFGPGTLGATFSWYHIQAPKDRGFPRAVGMLSIDVFSLFDRWQF